MRPRYGETSPKLVGSEVCDERRRATSKESRSNQRG